VEHKEKRLGWIKLIVQDLRQGHGFQGPSELRSIQKIYSTHSPYKVSEVLRYLGCEEPASFLRETDAPWNSILTSRRRDLEYLLKNSQAQSHLPTSTILGILKNVCYTGGDFGGTYTKQGVRNRSEKL
jgi:hypothetical protein